MGGHLFKDFGIRCGDCDSNHIQNSIRTYTSLEKSIQPWSFGPICDECGSRQILLDFDFEKTGKPISTLYESFLNYRRGGEMEEGRLYNSLHGGAIHFLWPEVVDTFRSGTYYECKVSNRSPLLITRLQDSSYSKMEQKKIGCFWTLDAFALPTAQFRHDYSIAQNWNDLTQKCQMLLPVGLRYFIGEAAAIRIQILWWWKTNFSSL